MHRISLCIPVFDVLMKCCNLAKRDRYDSSCLIVLDVQFCKNQLSVRMGVGPKHTHANDINLQLLSICRDRGGKIKTFGTICDKRGDSTRLMAG